MSAAHDRAGGSPATLRPPSAVPPGTGRLYNEVRGEAVLESGAAAGANRCGGDPQRGARAAAWREPRPRGRCRGGAHQPLPARARDDLALARKAGSQEPRPTQLRGMQRGPFALIGIAAAVTWSTTAAAPAVVTPSAPLTVNPSCGTPAVGALFPARCSRRAVAGRPDNARSPRRRSSVTARPGSELAAKIAGRAGRARAKRGCGDGRGPWRQMAVAAAGLVLAVCRADRRSPHNPQRHHARPRHPARPARSPAPAVLVFFLITWRALTVTMAVSKAFVANAMRVRKSGKAAPAGSTGAWNDTERVDRTAVTDKRSNSFVPNP